MLAKGTFNNLAQLEGGAGRRRASPGRAVITENGGCARAISRALDSLAADRPDASSHVSAVR